MKGIHFLFITLLFAYLSLSSAAEITVTLQNGLNSYDGCDDAWVFGAYYNKDGQKSKNYGTETKMSVFYMNDGSELTREST